MKALKMCQIQMFGIDRCNQSCVHEEVMLGECLLALGAGIIAFEIFWKHKV
jgi:hypothetical protein